MFSKHRRIGLALGGGEARGLAHIGVLKVLEEEGIRVDFVSGTSVGSLMGALFCAGYGWQELRNLCAGVEWRDLVQLTLPGLGLMRTDKLMKTIDRLLDGARFEDLEIPFRAVAVDIGAAEEVVLGQGSVARAVQASSSIPGIFEPTDWDGRLLVDGGLINDVPADVVREMGADWVIGVDLNSDRISSRPPGSLIDVFFYSMNIMIRNAAQRGIGFTDLLIVPDLKGFDYHNLKRLDEYIERGEEAMRAGLAAIPGRV